MSKFSVGDKAIRDEQEVTILAVDGDGICTWRGVNSGGVCYPDVLSPAPAPAQPAAWVPGVGDVVQPIHNRSRVSGNPIEWMEKHLGRELTIVRVSSDCIYLNIDSSGYFVKDQLKLIRRASEPAQTAAGYAPMAATTSRAGETPAPPAFNPADCGTTPTDRRMRDERNRAREEAERVREQAEWLEKFEREDHFFGVDYQDKARYARLTGGER